MICNNCKKEIKTVMINMFDYTGGDRDVEIAIEDYPTNAKVVTTDKNWTGYELTEDEQRETISCPFCKKFPFSNKEIQVYEYIHIVCFDDRRDKKDE